ncbi:sialin-like isoform X2 [Chrysoperla carnea]|uniref:sialin-like isoform X2 n=1 Tax=Chrysoperla carnea TaxID=189513 RepID=UPI001D09694B|nr:sialin-like isoform X2 [Chrysoperla carnea]
MAIDISCRLILSIMAFFMFFVTQMIRSNLYIAIVAMIEYKNITVINNSTNDENKLYWEKNYIGILQGSFYWCFWITELPGAILAQRFGGRKILGTSIFIAAITNFIFPTAAKTHPLLASVVRALQGLSLGVTWPAMHNLSGKWIPKNERSKFMTTYQGTAIGSAISYPMNGLLIEAFGWEIVFYLTGVVTLVWTIFWWNLVYDSPSKHPRISEAEKEYLQNEISQIDKHIKLRTPWRSILRSMPFWAVLIASQGVIWCAITLQMQLPIYFDQIHNLNIKTNGLLLGIPDIFKFFFSCVFSSIMDYLLKSNKLSLTVIRKIAVGVSELGPATLLLILGYWGSTSPVMAMIIITLIVSFGGACSSGNLANIIDIAPNFAGVILGLIQTLCVISGVLSPIIASAILSNQEGGTD